MAKKDKKPMGRKRGKGKDNAKPKPSKTNKAKSKSNQREEKELRGKDVCIVDGKEIKRGYKVKDDFVIRAIRKLKKRFGMLRNNRLYVCEEHLEEYKKKRRNYERMAMIVLGLIGLLFAGAIILPLFSGGFAWESLIPFTIISVLMVLLLLTMHVPAIEEEITEVK